MSSKLRLALPMACIGVVGAACFLLLQSHASARVTMNYAHLNKIQKRIISETLASALGPQSSGAKRTSRSRSPTTAADRTAPRSRRRSPTTRPGGGSGSTLNYFPSSGELLGEPRQQRQGQPELPEPHRLLTCRGAGRPTTSRRSPSTRSTRGASSPATTTTSAATEPAARTSRRTAAGRGRTRRFRTASPTAPLAIAPSRVLAGRR